MKDFKEFVELEEGLKPEHKMRPGWMIKADPVLKAKIEANKKKQKEMKAILGKKLKEEVEQIDELSSDTLQKYKTAAHKSISNAAVKRHSGEMGSSEYRKNQDKRSKGINRADADKRLGTYKDKTPKKLDISGSANDIQKKYHSGNGGSRMSEEVEQIDELSNDTLASYKEKAGMSASEADKKGDFEKGNKRFKGIMKATFKQFANDAKK